MKINLFLLANSLIHTLQLLNPRPKLDSQFSCDLSSSEILKKMPQISCDLKFSKKISGLVGAVGFEPTAFCSRSKRATRLRYAPKLFDSISHAVIKVK